MCSPFLSPPPLPPFLRAVIRQSFGGLWLKILIFTCEPTIYMHTIMNKDYSFQTCPTENQREIENKKRSFPSWFCRRSLLGFHLLLQLLIITNWWQRWDRYYTLTTVETVNLLRRCRILSKILCSYISLGDTVGTFHQGILRTQLVHPIWGYCALLVQVSIESQHALSLLDFCREIP